MFEGVIQFAAKYVNHEIAAMGIWMIKENQQNHISQFSAIQIVANRLHIKLIIEHWALLLC